MIWGGCKNRVVVGLNLSISSLFVHVHSLCYSTSIKRSGFVPLCSQTLPGMTASCSGLPQLPDSDPKSKCRTPYSRYSATSNHHLKKMAMPLFRVVFQFDRLLRLWRATLWVQEKRERDCP